MHNIEREVLAGLLQDPVNITKILLKVRPEFFQDGANRKLYTLIIEHYRKYNTVLSRSNLELSLENSALPDKAKKQLLLVYEETVLLSGKIKDFDFLVDSLKSSYIRTSVHTALKESVNLWDQGKTTAALDVMRNEAAKITINLEDESSFGSIQESANVRKDKYLQIKQNPNIAHGLFTGFPTFDNSTNGLMPGELVIIISGTAEGKSTMLLNIGHYIQTQLEKSVLFVSLENPKVQLERRYDSLDANLPCSKLKAGALSVDEEKLYFEALEKQKQRKGIFYILDLPGMCTSSMILAKYNELNPLFHFDIIIVDYLGLMKPDKSSKSIWEDVGNVALELRQLARMLKVPVLTAAQVSRESHKIKGTKYGVANIALSYLITNHADIVLSLKVNNPEVLEISDIAELTVSAAKVRDGARFSFIADACFGRMKIQERVIKIKTT
jgi:replicative DNA helicase